MGDRRIPQEELAVFLGYAARSMANLILVRAYLPKNTTEEELIEKIEAFCREKGIDPKGVCEPDELRLRKTRIMRGGRDGRKRHWGGYTHASTAAPIEEGEEDDVNLTRLNLTDEELAHFGLKLDPFDRIVAGRDIYESRRLETIRKRIVKGVARHDMMAVVGPVGSGKSTLLRRILHELSENRDVRIIAPATLDKTNVRPNTLTGAIIEAFGYTKIPSSEERRAALAMRILKEKHGEKMQPVLYIDEAHDLLANSLIALKRLWDSGVLFHFLAVLLVGQGGRDTQGYPWGLLHTIEQEPEVREFAERCLTFEMPELKTDARPYIEWCLARAVKNGSALPLVEDAAYAALAKRAGEPQRMNRLLARCLKAAKKRGLKRITAEIVEGV